MPPDIEAAAQLDGYCRLFLVAGFLQGDLAARETRDRLGSAALFYLLLEFIHFRPATRRGFNADFDGVSH